MDIPSTRLIVLALTFAPMEVNVDQMKHFGLIGRAVWQAGSL